MGERSTHSLEVSPERHAIRDKCFHPSRLFVEFPKEEIEQSVPERFEKIVRLYPDRIAVKMGARELTYNDLNHIANRIAHAILAMRGPESEPIALLFEHGINVIAAIFGVLKAGKFYVALDLSLPPERARYILEDSQASVVVTNNRNMAFAEKLTEGAHALLNIDEMDWTLSSDNPLQSISPNDVAAITYTSGSTGTPKGVVHTHRKLLDKFAAYTDIKHVSFNDRVTHLLSHSFASAQGDLLVSLLNGATLFPFDIKFQGVARFARFLKEEQITVCHLPVSLFRQLAESIATQEKISDLRLIYLSGAPITRLDFDLYRKTFSERTALEIGMGSTETGGVACAIVDHTFCFPEEGTPVGYPYPGKKILLLDENGHEVGSNEIGEIAVKSRNLSLGYWRRPELTETKFWPDPGGGDERIYLTGDLGRLLPDGFLIHVGRKDFMVKIRGYRVDFAEIERAMLAHPRVREAAVLAWDRDRDEMKLVAYIVCRQQPALTVNELFEFLREKIPDYMMPSAVVFLDSLPLTNGKLDRKALPRSDGQRPEIEQAYVPAQSEVEQKLVEIWQAVLAVRPIGIHDNFFDLGGHSLAATRLISRVIQEFHLELPIKALFESPTVAAMSNVILQHQANQAGPGDLERILNDVEAMSDEEAERVLKNLTGKVEP
jgi:amino acid adenylation domain-containing protein